MDFTTIASLNHVEDVLYTIHQLIREDRDRFRVETDLLEDIIRDIRKWSTITDESEENKIDIKRLNNIFLTIIPKIYSSLTLEPSVYIFRTYWTIYNNIQKDYNPHSWNSKEEDRPYHISEDGYWTNKVSYDKLKELFTATNWDDSNQKVCPNCHKSIPSGKYWYLFGKCTSHNELTGSVFITCDECSSYFLHHPNARKLSSSQFTWNDNEVENMENVARVDSFNENKLTSDNNTVMVKSDVETNNASAVCTFCRRKRELDGRWYTIDLYNALGEKIETAKNVCYSCYDHGVFPHKNTGILQNTYEEIIFPINQTVENKL